MFINDQWPTMIFNDHSILPWDFQFNHGFIIAFNFLIDYLILSMLHKLRRGLEVLPMEGVPHTSESCQSHSEYNSIYTLQYSPSHLFKEIEYWSSFESFVLIYRPWTSLYVLLRSLVKWRFTWVVWVNEDGGCWPERRIIRVPAKVSPSDLSR